jgi:hypothetical protein
MGRVPSDPALTYRVYTADHIPCSTHRRVPPPPSPWLPVKQAAIEIALAARDWARSPKPRAHLVVALQDPFDLFVATLRPALKTVDWRRVGIGIAIGVGTAITILLAVLFVADLADGSAKPRASRATSVSVPMNVNVNVPVPEPASDPGPTVEPVPEPVPTHVAGKPPPPARGRGKKPVEVFIP